MEQGYRQRRQQRQQKLQLHGRTNKSLLPQVHKAMRNHQPQAEMFMELPVQGSPL